MTVDYRRKFIDSQHHFEVCNLNISKQEGLLLPPTIVFRPNIPKKSNMDE